MATQKIRSVNQLIYLLDLPEEENRIVEVIGEYLSDKQVGAFYQIADLVGLDGAYVIHSNSLSDEVLLEIAQKLGFFIGKHLKVAIDQFGPLSRVPLTANALSDAIASIRQNLVAFPPEPPTDSRLRDITLMQQLMPHSAVDNFENPIEEDILRDLDADNASIVGTYYFWDDTNVSEDEVPRKKQSPKKAAKEKQQPTGNTQPPQTANSTAFKSTLSDAELARRLKFRSDMEYQIEQLTSPESVKREVVRRFTRLEKVEVQKESRKNWPPAVHNPRQTANFLKAFASEEPLKFATHTYDEGTPFSYNHWISQCNLAFKLIELERFQDVPLQTRAKVRSFLFESDPKKGWGFDKIPFGWSHPELKRWCTENPGVCPSSPPSMPMPRTVKDALANGISPMTAIPDFEALCRRFAREIRFRGSEGAYLEKFLREKSRLAGLGAPHRISYDENLRSLDFYLDVDRFSAALKHILITIKERLQHLNVHFMGKDMADRVEIKVHHEGSVVTRASTDPKVAVDTLTGDLKSAWNNLRGHCHWSMEAAFTDGKKRLHYLGEVGQPAVEDAPETEGGVLHTFTFLKPDK